ENLDFQKLTWIPDFAGRFDQSLDHVELVIDRKLHRDSRLNFESSLRFRDLSFVFQIKVDEVITMDTVHRQHDQDREIRNDDDNIEEGQTVKSVPMINGRKLIETCFLRRKDQSKHDCKRVHLVKISPAKVTSNRMLM